MNMFYTGVHSYLHIIWLEPCSLEFRNQRVLNVILSVCGLKLLESVLLRFSLCGCFKNCICPELGFGFENGVVSDPSGTVLRENVVELGVDWVRVTVRGKCRNLSTLGL